jgi:hypothetical protein
LSMTIHEVSGCCNANASLKIIKTWRLITSVAPACGWKRLDTGGAALSSWWRSHQNSNTTTISWHTGTPVRLCRLRQSIASPIACTGAGSRP